MNRPTLQENLARAVRDFQEGLARVLQEKLPSKPKAASEQPNA